MKYRHKIRFGHLELFTEVIYHFLICQLKRAHIRVQIASIVFKFRLNVRFFLFLLLQSLILQGVLIYKRLVILHKVSEVEVSLPPEAQLRPLVHLHRLLVQERPQVQIGYVVGDR